jgi:hypothetical protein
MRVAKVQVFEISKDHPTFDEYPDEEEQIPTSIYVDLRRNQPMYDNYFWRRNQ